MANLLKDMIANANRILEKAMDPSTKDVPTELFEKAEGLIIFSVVQAGAGISFKSGRGILLCKKHEGKWSNPVAFDLTEFGFGVTFGVDAKDCIMFITDPNALRSLIRDRFGHTHVGPDISATVARASGAVGEELDSLKATTVTFSKGAFLGVKANWGGMRCPEFENEKFYGPHVTPMKIILGEVEFPATPKTEIDQVYEKLYQLTQYKPSG